MIPESTLNNMEITLIKYMILKRKKKLRTVRVLFHATTFRVH